MDINQAKSVVEAVVKAERMKNKFEINGEQFVISLYLRNNGQRDLSLWAKNGTKSIYGCYYEECDNDEVIHRAMERIQEFLDGFIHCSACGVKFPFAEVDGYKRSYFAGSYCQHCWDTKWKAIEAKETYN